MIEKIYYTVDKKAVVAFDDFRYETYYPYKSGESMVRAMDHVIAVVMTKYPKERIGKFVRVDEVYGGGPLNLCDYCNNPRDCNADCPGFKGGNK